MKTPKIGAAIKGYTPEKARRAKTEMAEDPTPAKVKLTPDIHTKKLEAEAAFRRQVQANVRKAMTAASITEAKMAHRVGWTVDAMKHFLNSEEANPTMTEVGRVAAALGFRIRITFLSGEG
jgi:DNA-binding phage protein